METENKKSDDVGGVDETEGLRKPEVEGLEKPETEATRVAKEQRLRSPIVRLTRLEDMAAEKSGHGAHNIRDRSPIIARTLAQSMESLFGSVSDLSGADESDESSQSSVSMVSSRKAGKRPLPPEARESAGVSPAQRGRGRPPTTGQYVDLRKARQDLEEAETALIRRQAEEDLAAARAANKGHPERDRQPSGEHIGLHKEIEAKAAAERDIIRLQAEKGLVRDRSPRPSTSKAVKIADLVVPIGDPKAQTATTIGDKAASNLLAVREVAQRSGHLKGEFIKFLNVATTNIKVALEELTTRTQTEEMAQLKADNARLNQCVANLRMEMAQMIKEMRNVRRENAQRRENVAGERAPQGAQGFDIILQRLAAIEERLPPAARLRPPLAADRAREVTRAPSVEAAPMQAAPLQDAPSRSAPAQAASKKETRVSRVAKKAAPPKEAPAQTPSTSADNAWTTVGKGGKPSPQAKKKGKRGKRGGKSKRTPRLTAPKTAAVVIMLPQSELEKGVTYASVINKARQRVDLASLGLETGVDMVGTATGAKLLQVSGEDRSRKADALADSIREVLARDVEGVIVSRPVMCAEMRIRGLDDTVTVEEVAAAIAGKTNCALDAVKVGKIRTNARGSGTVWVRCPIEAAKSLGAEGRLLVGWSAARVELLQPKRLRCFRCLEPGHTQTWCRSPVDRSGECYRCGQLGHKADSCSAAVRCSVCAAAGKPAEHRVGGKSCVTPKKKKGLRPPGYRPPAAPVPPQTSEGPDIEMPCP